MTEIDVSIYLDTKMSYSGLLMWLGLSKNHYFIDFLAPFFWRLWSAGMLLLTKSKGYKSNAPYSGFSNPFQTKSNLHISIQKYQIQSLYQFLMVDPVEYTKFETYTYVAVSSIAINLVIFSSGPFLWL